MMEGKRFQKLFAVAGQLDQNLTPIVRRAQTAEKAAFNQTIDELNGAVMLQLHPFGQHADVWFQVFWKTADREQKLVLLRFDPRLASRVLAETQKSTDLITQFRHCFEVGLGRFFCHIISCCDSIV